MPRVNRTRLRRSGIRKIFANFSSMFGFSASGETARVTYQSSVCANEAACRRICAGTLKFDLVRLEISLAVFPDTDLKTFAFRRRPSIRRLGCRGRSRHNRFAAGLFDLLDSRLGELMSMDGDRPIQLTRAQHLDQSLLARNEPQLLVVFERDLLHGELREAVEIYNRVLGAEDIGEAALRKPAVQRHLAAL